MTIEEAYLKIQSECGIEVRDAVRVLRTAKAGEMGWDNTWDDDMEVGGTEIVNSIDQYGIALDDFWYPFFVLELIEKKVAKEVTMADVCKKFGCEVKIKKEISC